MRFSLLICLMLTGSAFGLELSPPKGEVLLTISGNIEFLNSENGAEFDRDMLEQLGTTSITTENPWTEAATTFTGVEIGTLLKAVGAKSSAFRAVASDNYWYDIKKIDFGKYPVVLAYKRDGKYMSARNLGPLWIMFPFDDFPELLTEVNKASCVWQLKSLVIQ